MPHLSPNLAGNDHYLFGNIAKIYCTTKKFYDALQKCGSDPEVVASTFTNFVSYNNPNL